jgi:anti-sigma regulatory factor (Ser/Thr protein kinase)
VGQLCEIDMDGNASSIPKSRSFVTATLEAWGLQHLEERAVLLVSELATNAVLHAGTPFRISMILGDALIVEVTDQSEEMPRVEANRVDSEHGRGLRLVSQFASDWGWRPAGRGKTVWFSLALDPAEVENLGHTAPAGSRDRQEARPG